LVVQSVQIQNKVKDFVLKRHILRLVSREIKFHSLRQAFGNVDIITINAVDTDIIAAYFTVISFVHEPVTTMWRVFTLYVSWIRGVTAFEIDKIVPFWAFFILVL
jgi:hypothetical protein